MLCGYARLFCRHFFRGQIDFAILAEANASKRKPGTATPTLAFSDAKDTFYQGIPALAALGLETHASSRRNQRGLASQGFEIRGTTDSELE